MDIVTPGVGRRNILVGGAALAASGAVLGPRALANASTEPRNAPSVPHVVLLGTQGGPGWSASPPETGISTAVVVGDASYLVDVGDGAATQFVNARPGGGGLYDEFSTLRAVFLTHLHSDHISDLGKLMLYGWWQGVANAPHPINVIGPGPRKSLPRLNANATVEPPVVHPANPGPGTVNLVRSLYESYAVDINDRMRDNLMPDLRGLFAPEDVVVPGQKRSWETAHSNPRVRPWKVFEDDRVRVTATLVDHFPVYPAFAYRFDTDGGSVVISGDTGPSDNLIELADGADTLLHEVIDLDALAVAGLPESALEHLREAHTSVKEVGRIAEAAGVKHLVLHHYVPTRLPKDAWRRAQKGFSGKVTLGKDLMTVRIR